VAQHTASYNHSICPISSIYCHVKPHCAKKKLLLIPLNAEMTWQNL